MTLREARGDTEFVGEFITDVETKVERRFRSACYTDLFIRVAEGMSKAHAGRQSDAFGNFIIETWAPRDHHIRNLFRITDNATDVVELRQRTVTLEIVAE